MLYEAKGYRGTQSEAEYKALEHMYWNTFSPEYTVLSIKIARGKSFKSELKFLF